MASLIEELKLPKNNLQEFHDLTIRVLNYMPAIISTQAEERGYILCTSQAAGTLKYIRPIKSKLFLFKDNDFSLNFNLFLDIISNLRIRNKDKLNENSYLIIDSVAYTIQQSIGVGFDLLGDPNSSRKHVGNRFEELLRLIVSELGISNKKIVFKIPYDTEEGEKLYSCETDIIISPYGEVISDMQSLNLKEIIISSKTTSKDRMGKVFLDKILMERFFNHDVKLVAIFLNDVQRATRKDGTQTISYTLVSGLFMVYTEFLVKLDGVYFIDPPPNTMLQPLNRHIFTFSKNACCFCSV